MLDAYLETNEQKKYVETEIVTIDFDTFVVRTKNNSSRHLSAMK